MNGVGLLSIAVDFPGTVVTNADARRTDPELYAQAERRTLARLWAPADADDPSDFDHAFAPFAQDPFRGTVERRALQPGESMLPIEVRAAREALAAAAMSASEVDVVLACSFLPEHVGIGNAVFIAKELKIAGPAWNVETACSSATACLQLATALVRAHQARRVLVVVSCSYSRVADPADTLGWFLGDGCTAFVVGPCADELGIIAAKNINTAQTCGAFRYVLEVDDDRTAHIRVGTDGASKSGQALRDTAVSYLRECVTSALEAADCAIDDVALFAFNTPTAWYADLCARALGISGARTINTYPLYANIGPVLWPVNLHHAASLGRVRPGDLVLVYSVGTVSSAGAVVMRWGDVGLGPLPRRVRTNASTLADKVRVRARE